MVGKGVDKGSLNFCLIKINYNMNFLIIIWEKIMNFVNFLKVLYCFNKNFR